MEQHKHWGRELVLAGLVAVGLGFAPRDAAAQTTFVVRLENVAEQPLNTSKGPVPFTLSPGVWVVHTGANPLFVPFHRLEGLRGTGLENLAEDGKQFEELPQAVRTEPGVKAVGVFDTPESKMEKGGLKPGMQYEFTVTASPGDHFSLATMFAASNDLFYAPYGTGIPLFNEAGNPISGDVTSMVALWDAGTEVNEEPGVGPTQAHRQPRPNYGPAEGAAVRPITAVNDGFTYPQTNRVIRVTITPKMMVRKDGR